MPRLKWDEEGKKTYETGVSRGVLYKRDSTGAYGAGEVWNGLSSVTESPSGAETTAIYADNIKYLNMVSAEELGATIEAYMYPDSFMECDGTKELVPGVMIGQQGRSTFGLCYRTEIGNDTQGQNYGYKLHLLYGALASPSERQYQTINDSPEANTMSWEVTTTPVPVTKIPNAKPTALVTITSTKVAADKLKALEDILYGKDGDSSTTARLPLPDELFDILGGTTEVPPVSENELP